MAIWLREKATMLTKSTQLTVCSGVVCPATATYEESLRNAVYQGHIVSQFKILMNLGGKEDECGQTESHSPVLGLFCL